MTFPSNFPWIDWIADPNSDNDETLEPFLDEGFESEPDSESDSEGDDDE